MFAADVLWGLSLAGFVFVAGMFVVRGVAQLRRHRRLHQRRANKRFMAGYRAGHRQARRTIVEAASTTPRRPVVRPPTPAGAGGPRPPAPAPAGPTSRGRHAA